MGRILFLFVCVLTSCEFAHAMEVNGPLKGAVAENLEDDPTGGGAVAGRFYFDSVNEVFRGLYGATWRSWATLDGTETFTNKTLTSPSVVEPVFDNFVEFNEEDTPATPAAGKVRVYAKDDGKLYKTDSSGIEQPIGSGVGGGSINYVPSPDSAVGWTESGGVLATTTTDADKLPNAGFDSQALLLTGTGGSNGSAQSACFVVGDAYRNSIVGFSFDKKTSSGFTSGSFTAALMKCSDDSCASCAAAKFIGGSDSIEISKGAGNVYAETVADATSYYIDFGGNYFGTADGEWLALSSITVGPDTRIMGAVIGEVFDLTPSINDFNNNADLGIDAADSYLKWWRDGDKLWVSGFYDFTGDGSSTSNLTLKLSVIENAIGATIDKSMRIDREISLFTNGTGYEGGHAAILPGDTAIRFYSVKETSVLDGDDFGTSATRHLQLSFNFWLPVVEWAGKGTTQMLTQGHLYANARAIYNDSGTAAVEVASSGSTFVTIKYNTKEHDNYDRYNTSTGVYTIPADGVYKVMAAAPLTTSVDSGRAIIGLYKNSSRIYQTKGFTGSDVPVLETAAYFSAGDELTVRLNQNSGSPITIGGAAITSRFVVIRDDDYTHGTGVGLGLATADNPGLISKFEEKSISPTYVNALTGIGSHAFHYQIIGKWCHFTYYLDATGGGMTGGTIEIELPVPIAVYVSNGRAVGNGLYRPSASNFYDAYAWISAEANTMKFVYRAVDSTGITDITGDSMTSTNGQITVQGKYEIQQ